MRKMIALSVVASIACGGTGTEPVPVHPFVDVIGAYRLTTVNGQPLPFVLSSLAGTTTSITNGQLVLRADSIFVRTTTTALQSPNALHVSTNAPWGSYTVSGGAITLRYSFSSGGHTEQATRINATVAVPDGPRALAFTRQ